ncbi:MAG: cytochrome c biogenesis protein CcsA, partial [Bacillota bacterium]|nr:cytochrome c biogenesis protein CcsA [Bacillota bacterium]
MSQDVLLSTLGTALLWLTLGGSLLALLFFFLPQPHPWGKGALYLAASSALLSSFLMEYLLLTDRFAFLYVAAHSSRATPFIYKAGALWGGQEGSLLFWLTLLLLFSSLLARRVPREPAAQRLWPRALGILSGIGVFFALLLTVAAPPFTLLSSVPADGMGLNRLLRDPAMLLHPVALYSGFVGLSIPYAFAMAGL